MPGTKNDPRLGTTSKRGKNLPFLEREKRTKKTPQERRPVQLAAQKIEGERLSALYSTRVKLSHNSRKRATKMRWRGSKDRYTRVVVP